MGLAPYGKPKYAQTILDHLIDVKADGSFRLNMDYFYYCTGLTMTDARSTRSFGGPPRQPDQLLDAAPHGSCRLDPGGDWKKSCCG